MNALSKRKPRDWEQLVVESLNALDGVTKPTSITPYKYGPRPITQPYELSRPQVIVAPDPGRLVVRFLSVDTPDARFSKFHLDALAVFDGNLDLVPGETRNALGDGGTTTSPFFTASLVPRAYGGAAPTVVNTLAVAALGVGLLAAAIANKRIKPPKDSDLGLRLQPHYTNLMINQFHMALQVGAQGGGPKDVRRITEQAENDFKDAVDGWKTAGGWKDKEGRAFEKTFGDETVRLWRPTIATLLDSYVLVLKIDRDIGSLDDHVAMTMVVERDGTIASVIGDVYYSSADTVFTVEKTRRAIKAMPLRAWIDELRKRSVEAGLPALQFATGVGELLIELAEQLKKHPLPPVKLKRE